uniref:hypothetical protein n=1 Tax=Marinobacterium profundum TaxID=1714300 RepID=UPI0008317FE9|nr:hypothetical protein [Marinobacterium profundum]
MDLDEFITSVLVKVVSGIREAQQVDSVGAFIVPSGDGGHKYPVNARVSSSAQLKSTIIDFDVAVTVESSDKSTGKGGIKVAGIGGNIEGESVTKDIRVSRIQFGVPILLPESQKNWFDELKDK